MKSKEVDKALRTLGYTEKEDEDNQKMIYKLLSRFVEEQHSWRSHDNQI